jgi:patatin-related protein
MSPPVEHKPERELRLAVVMYGGVSLAIYMNGVAQELLNLVRATAPDPKDPLKARFSDAALPGRSAAVYREVARGGTEPQAPGGPIRQRVVVDILSGTSAGGINAIYLAKALANDQSLDGLARLWETEADLGLLINDSESRVELAPSPPRQPPRSLLNSRRMYLKLHEAFDRMDGDPPRTGLGLVDELDLFVTTTDITGLPVRLQLGGGEVAEERRYRKAFHLRFKANSTVGTPGPHDFTVEDNPFLAFIARCTSSFPFAFEPMQLAQAEERWLGEKGIKDRSRWARHFAEYAAGGGADGRWEQRPFGDGGYLDNKPFSYAVDTIAERSGSRTARVERKLIFVDPAPERVLRERPEEGVAVRVPNAVENVLTALQLPAYETIREDLLRLRERNRVVDKVQSVVLGVTDDFNRLNVEQNGELVALLNDRDGFVRRDLNTVIPLFGAAYGGYHRLKVGNLTDELAGLLATQAGIPLDSDESRLLRFLVRAWRDLRYCRNPAEERARAVGASGAERQTEFAFLQDFDLSYRARRLAFTIEQINRLSSATAEERRQTIGYVRAFGEDAPRVAERWQEVLDELHQRRRQLVEILGALRDGRETLYAPRGASLAGTGAEHWKTIREGITTLGTVSGDRERKTRATALLTDEAQGLTTMQAVQEALARAVGDLARRSREGCAQAVAEVMKAEMPARRAGSPAGLADNIVRHYYAWYELYDSMVFPIVHGSEVGEEIAAVEPVRISPLTGRAASGDGTMDPKLLPAGVALGHFGGFLNAEWRSRDIMLGRLNAAEKLIQMLLTGVLPDPVPGQPDRRGAVIRSYVERAWEAIVTEELERRDRRQDQVNDRQVLAARVESFLNRFREEGLAKEELSRQRTLDWLTRSVQVTGRLFDIAADGTVAKQLTGILVRAGQVLSAVGEVAVPRHWWGLLYRRWVAQLWLFGVLLAVLGLVFGQDQMRRLGLELVGVVSGFWALALLVQGWTARSVWLRRLRFTLLVVVLALVIVGALHLWSLRQVPLDWLGRLLGGGGS